MPEHLLNYQDFAAPFFKLKEIIPILPEHGLNPDIVALGGSITPKTLQLAYSEGIFPWPVDDHSPLLWFSPQKRGILFYKDLHISRSLKKILRKENFEHKTNTCFLKIMQLCAEIKRKDQAGTWIIPSMFRAYLKLNEKGLAHSIEVFSQNELVGGLYGVMVKNVFSAESMFFLKSGASKAALIYLMNTLHNMGINWIDTQVCTQTTENMGGSLISKKHYYDLLKQAHNTTTQTWPQ